MCIALKLCARDPLYMSTRYASASIPSPLYFSMPKMKDCVESSEVDGAWSGGAFPYVGFEDGGGVGRHEEKDPQESEAGFSRNSLLTD